MKNEEYKKLSISEFTKAAGRYESNHAGIYEMCKKDYPDILASFSISNKRSKLVLVSFCTLPFCNRISHPAVNIKACTAAFLRIFSCCLKCQFHKKSGTNREHCL